MEFGLRYRVVLWLALASFVLTGCGSMHDQLSERPAGAAAVSGILHGGQQPVTDSTIQLYEVGTSGDGSAAKPLLQTTVTTSDGSGLPNSNANAGNLMNTLPAGSFTITGLYTCDSPSSYVYLAATGGNPGQAAGTNNTNIQMMAMLGQCGTLSNSAVINMDEVTTMGGLAALYPYVTSLSSIGYNSTTDASAFATAANTVNEYVNNSTGTAPGPTLPTNTYASSNEINALADVLSVCVNVVSGSANDGSTCGQLLGDATPSSSSAPTNIFAAALNILNNPTLNVSAIYGLIPANSAFQPVPATPPTAWALPIEPIAATPTFSEPSGTYTCSGTYCLVTTATSTTPGATIYCTTDGSTPSTASQVEDQSQGIPVSAGAVTVKCIATASGYGASVVGSASYTVKPNAPTFTPPTGTYSSGLPVSIISPDGLSSSIYYTTNGTTPNTSSNHYISPFTITSTTTVKAAVIVSGVTSTVSSATYTIH